MSEAKNNAVVVKKGDFVEIKFTGYTDGKPFDSNIQEDIEKIHPEAKAEPMIVAIGAGMLVKGLDEFLAGKEVGKELHVKLPPKEAFGERNRNLVKTIPLKVFHEKEINPFPGASFYIDNAFARVITVSGARVITDFNNPLAGKEVEYKVNISREVSDEKEKAEAFFKYFFRMIPEFKISATDVTIMAPEPYKILVDAFKDKFLELVKKNLAFELKEIKSAEADASESSEPKAQQ